MYGGVVEERETRYEHDASRFGCIHERPRLAQARRERLLDQHMLAGFDSLQTQRVVTGRRRGDNDGVDGGHGSFEIWIPSDVAVDQLGTAFFPRKPLVDPYNRRDAGRGPQHAHVPRTPIADANDTDPYALRSPQHNHASLLPFIRIPPPERTACGGLRRWLAASRVFDTAGNPARQRLAKHPHDGGWRRRCEP